MDGGNDRTETVAELGEDRLIERLVAGLPTGGNVVVGPGDDCAVIDTGAERHLLLKTDCLIEAVHFARGTDAHLVGEKAMKRVVSDIAAMGGTPKHALVTLALNDSRSVDEVSGWYAGMAAVAASFDCVVVGGETSRLPGEGAVISIAMTGEVLPEHCVLRSGARRGDLILVSGRLGGSFESGRHLRFTPRIREAQWLVSNHRPSAMMDLSDGLGSDLPRLAQASGEGYTVSPDRLPCHEGVSTQEAVSDGEDYELLFTIAPEKTGMLMVAWANAFPEVALTIIGEVTEDTPLELSRGWEHFKTNE
ncbi:MAG: thiamine-phosphate kinase [Verrucomicrobiales bacterium]|nr:thiamine-phosphate kinase [Verrucomicrobiales bacterium]